MTLSVQFYTLVAMIGMGVVLGMAVDTYRILLRSGFHRNGTKYICDFLFWILYTVILFRVLYWINEGTLRIHVLLAVLCGFAMYKALLDAVYTHFMLLVYRIISKTIYFLSKILKVMLIRPMFLCIRSIYYVSRRLVLGICRMIWFAVRLIYRCLYWIARIFWRFLPETLRNRLSRLYCRGYRVLRVFYRRGLSVYRKLKSWRQLIKNKRGCKEDEEEHEPF